MSTRPVRGEFPAPSQAGTTPKGIEVTIAIQKDKLFLDFGTNLRWMEFDPEGALKFSNELREAAIQALANRK